MSLTQVVDVFGHMPLSAGVDFSRPLGQWEAVGVAIGDASGGTLTMTLLLPKKWMYSLEAVHQQRTGPGFINARFTWPSDTVPGGVAPQWHLEGVNLGNESLSRPRDAALRLPLTRPNQSAPRVISMVWQTNLVTEIYRCSWWGYYWDYRATLSVEGPVRPF